MSNPLFSTPITTMKLMSAPHHLFLIESPEYDLKIKCINITNLFVLSHCLKYTRTAKHKGKKLKQNKFLIFPPPLHIPSLLIFISQKSCIFLTKAKEYCSGLQLRFHTSDRSYKKQVSLT